MTINHSIVTLIPRPMIMLILASIRDPDGRLLADCECLDGSPHGRLTQLANKWRKTLAKNVICLWYDGTAEEAARFYARTFPDSAVTAVHHAPGDYPDGKQGQVLTVEFTVVGVACLGLNGGPAFKHSEAFSFQIVTED